LIIEVRGKEEKKKSIMPTKVEALRVLIEKGLTQKRRRGR